MSEARWDIPTTWQWTAANDIADIVGGGTPSTTNLANFSDNGIPWLTPADLTGYGETYISKGKRDVSEMGLNGSGATVVPAGTVLFSSRAPIGYCAIAANEIATNQGFKSLVLKGGISPEYMRHYLLASREYAESKASGTTFKELSGRKVGQLTVPIAPLPEQKRIVAKLDRLTARSKRAREELDAIPRLVARYKQAVLAAAFRGDLTADWRANKRDVQSAKELIESTPEPTQSRGGREATDTNIEGRAALSVNVPSRPAPEGWAWVNLRRIARQETGHTPSRQHPEYWTGEIPWIGIKDAGNHHGGVIMDTIQHVSQAGLDNSSARLLPAGTVCLSRTASVGYVVMMGQDMATSQDFVTWTCSEALDPEYLMYALLAEGDDIRRFGKGTTHTTIYFPEVRALHICLAPKLEQQEITRRIEHAFSVIDRLAAEHGQAAALLDRLDQSILARAFRGELAPQDPNDEPASVLLERIRAERAAAPRRKRGRRGRRQQAEAS